MKAKDWREKERIDPMKGAEIKCPDCGRHIGYEREFMHMVISPPGIVCPDCDEIVIAAPAMTM